MQGVDRRPGHFRIEGVIFLSFRVKKNNVSRQNPEILLLLGLSIPGSAVMFLYLESAMVIANGIDVAFEVAMHNVGQPDFP